MASRRTPGFSKNAPTGRFFGTGELRIALLGLLEESPAHGYELMTRLQARCGGAYKASAGAIYPTLQQLEKEDLIRVQARDGKRVASLTHTGKKFISVLTDDLERIWEKADDRSKWGVFKDPMASDIVAPSLRLAKAALKTIVHGAGDATVIEDVLAILDRARADIDALRTARRAPSKERKT